MEWKEVDARMPNDAGAGLRSALREFLDKHTKFRPEAIKEKVVVLKDNADRRMLWGYEAAGIQSLHLGPEIAAQLPHELVSRLPNKRHSARQTYLGVYEGPAFEIRRPEDFVLLHALSGDLLSRAVDRWVSVVRQHFPGWIGSLATPTAFDSEERDYKVSAREVLKSDLDQASSDEQRFEALFRALKGTNLLNWRVYEPLSANGAANRVAMTEAVGQLLASADEPLRHPNAIAEFVASWMNNIPEPQRDHARQVAEYALMLLRPSEAIFFRRSVLDDLYYEATATRFPRGDAADEYSDALAFACKIEIALTTRGSPPRDLIDVQSFLWVVHNYGSTSSDSSVSESHLEKENAGPMKSATNLIFFGPPGTGKTYATASTAVRLCLQRADKDPLFSPENRVGLMKEYRALVASGRIEFVTFHQSFSYEEFIEGLRPTTEKLEQQLDSDDVPANAQTGGFRLEPRDGVLKRISERARLDQGESSEGKRLDRSRRIFKIALGRRGAEENQIKEGIEKGLIHLGWGGDIDWSDDRFIEFAEIRKEWNEKKDPAALGKDANIEMMYSFRAAMQVGDYVVLSDGRDRFRAFGKVTGEYYFDKSAQYHPHRRSVTWVWVHDEGAERGSFYPKPFRQHSVYQLNSVVIDWDALEATVLGINSSTPKAGARDYVLIIDEINRANISKVFGELITLLEPDKRLGQLNEIMLRLPYSGASFGVPSNLHIIGTMNTADRSIALLDTALRRRFEFRELMPDASLLPELVDGIDLRRLLLLLNERIEYLFDREHQIGHAYFIDCKTKADVEDTMRRKVIPLLAEYFFEDWGKVAAVLGDATLGNEGYFEGKFLRRFKLGVTGAGEANGDSAERFRWSVKEQFNFLEFTKT